MPKDKFKTVYVCTNCGETSPRWMGRCPSCGAWNTMAEDVVREEKPVRASAGGKGAVRGISSGSLITAHTLSEISATEEKSRIITGISELDRVLGGGIVLGSVVLLGGEPGAGKSTLLLQLCGAISKAVSVLYITGEESTRQIKLRALRLEVPQDGIRLAAETEIDDICVLIEQEKPGLVVIDSIQTMHCGDISSSAGSVSQVKECTSRLLAVAKNHEIPTFIVGHVNKDGAIAGPKVMEHIVDTVLYFEGDRHASYRILRGVKNRFGSTNEIGVFEMRETGLEEVPNPSEYMLNGRPEDASGSVVACSMEGTRPILMEIQALVCRSNFGMPRRTAAGTDYNRVNLLMAVLEKRVGLPLSNYDAYINIAGGIRMNEPAIDLGIVMAIVSSYKNQSISPGTIVFGEVGLSGEVRAVSMPEQRVAEARKLGFKTCIMPQVSKDMLKKVEGIEVIGVKSVNQAINLI